MADNWAAARAAKARKRQESENKVTLTKKQKNKVEKTIKKSPILLIIVIALLLGIVCGFFAFTFLSPFEMKGYSINGVNASENDYIVVDMSDIKTNYLKNHTDADMEDVFSSVELIDLGVDCKFFGIDVSDTVTTKYYYREDISHDYQSVDEIDVTTAGVYYIEYTSSHFAFKDKTLIRTIIVTGVENDG